MGFYSLQRHKNDSRMYMEMTPMHKPDYTEPFKDLLGEHSQLHYLLIIQCYNHKPYFYHLNKMNNMLEKRDSVSSSNIIYSNKCFVRQFNVKTSMCLW
ncbi:uncharacterized protein [Parasteatoda tepidariorum]|uniref:uncharacterized protein isoform X3 n=1 Tax=Parasteatoda tepidariorum TaxID=114398 RepID=UPI001C7248F6|nr:uncharacterized protein LOC122271685 isoform X2 [Parasteatoda tepidariorum]